MAEESLRRFPFNFRLDNPFNDYIPFELRGGTEWTLLANAFQTSTYFGILTVPPSLLREPFPGISGVLPAASDPISPGRNDSN